MSSTKKNAAAGNLRKALENPERNEWNETFIVIDATIRFPSLNAILRESENKSRNFCGHSVRLNDVGSPELAHIGMASSLSDLSSTPKNRSASRAQKQVAAQYLHCLNTILRLFRNPAPHPVRPVPRPSRRGAFPH